MDARDRVCPDTGLGDRVSDSDIPSTGSGAYGEAGGRSPDAGAFRIEDGSLIDVARRHEASNGISRCSESVIGADSYLVSTYAIQRRQLK